MRTILREFKGRRVTVYMKLPSRHSSGILSDVDDDGSVLLTDPDPGDTPGASIIVRGAEIETVEIMPPAEPTKEQG